MENELEKIVEQDRNAIVTDVKVESNRTSFAKDVIVAKYNMEMLHINNFIAGAGNQRAKIESALNNHPEYVKQKIMEFANLGLSIANKDYYLIPYGNTIKFDIDYKGMLKVASMEARKNGYQLIAKADTIRKGFTRADVSTNGLIDNIIVENGKINEEIQTAYAILALMDIQTRVIIMQKVEVMPINEFQNAKNASKGGNVHKNFGTEMAKKMALRRAVKILNTMFASDILDKLFTLDNDNYDFKENEIETPKVNTDSLLGLIK